MIRVGTLPFSLPTSHPDLDAHADNFKDTLDRMSVIKTVESNSLVIFAGDFNADLGSDGGPKSTTPVNEQGKLLLHYVSKPLGVLFNLTTSSHHTLMRVTQGTVYPLLTISSAQLTLSTIS